MNTPWTVSAENGSTAFAEAPSIVTLDRVRKVYAGRNNSCEVIALDDFSL